jgi:protein-S-isoprenylcysteine O-methyltransferase Ste14
MLLRLELKIPPPVMTLLVAAAMWYVAHRLPASPTPAAARLAAGTFVGILGLACILAGLLALHRARTTHNPLKPESSSALVDGGIYRVSRNPMYLGLALLLVAWTAYLATPWVIAGPVAFVLYIGRFQIAPEERALEKTFGPRFAEYRASVRRWI